MVEHETPVLIAGGSLVGMFSAALLVVALTSTLTAGAADLKAKAEEAVKNFMLADPGLTDFFARAAGYAILPSVGEGGFIIGGQRGDGLVYEKTNVVGKVTMTEISVGAQVGGGSFAEIIFFETEEALQGFKKSKYEMSAKAKASVAASGVAANAKYEEGVAVFTLPKSGAMVAAAIGGQKFKFETLK
jgi:lipid-binding SYLF domain-containing protein